MIHLYEIVRPDPHSVTQFEPHYDTDSITPGAEWVLGHDADCDAVVDPSEAICTCGHSSLRVLAWPAPAGEGVLVRKSDAGLTYAHDISAMDILADSHPADAPIREAWVDLTRPYCGHGLTVCHYCGAPQCDKTPQPDGLYLFYGGELRRVEDVTDLWRAETARWPQTRTAAYEILCGRHGCMLRFDSPGKEPVWIDQALLEGSP